MTEPSLPVGIVEVLDALPLPAYLFAETGEQAFANQAAINRGRSLHEWNDASSAARARSTRVLKREFRIDGATWSLVIIDEMPRHVPAFAQALTPRMRQLAELLAHGESDKQIAREMGLTHASTRTYVRQLYQLLNVHSRAELVRAWMTGRGTPKK